MAADDAERETERELTADGWLYTKVILESKLLLPKGRADCKFLDAAVLIKDTLPDVTARRVLPALVLSC